MSSNSLRETYKKFCSAEGNQHIASEYAILKMQRLIDRFQMNSVLEIGLGIGAVAGSLLSVNANIKYSGTEENAFCLKALERNLNGNFQKLRIFSKLDGVPQEKFDFIIIDGKDNGLEKIRQMINKHGIICIEGDRLPQLRLLSKFFPRHKFVHSISLEKNPSYSPFPPAHWQGGLKIIFVKPDLVQNLWWLKEKVRTKLKYFFRSYLK